MWKLWYKLSTHKYQKWLIIDLNLKYNRFNKVRVQENSLNKTRNLHLQEIQCGLVGEGEPVQAWEVSAWAGLRFRNTGPATARRAQGRRESKRKSRKKRISSLHVYIIEVTSSHAHLTQLEPLVVGSDGSRHVGYKGQRPPLLPCVCALQTREARAVQGAPHHLTLRCVAPIRTDFTSTAW